MSTFHLMLPRQLPLEQAWRDGEAGLAPRHAMALLARRLGAQVHAPHADAGPGRFSDRMRSRLAGPPALWDAAREAVDAAGPEGCIFCVSEAGGLQVAGIASMRRERPRVCVYVHNLDRPRGRAALKLFGAARSVDLFLACSPWQVDFLRRYLHLGEDRVGFIWDHSDTRFFTPGPATPQPRPVIASVGLEQRDYRTLAAATHDLEVDVRISGASKDAAVLADTFPDPMPANMTRQFYAWPDLVQLYRDASVVVVSARENRYAAGVQSLMEAMACKRPVVVTATSGLAPYLDDAAVTAVPPGDAEAMRRAIVETLAKPASAAASAERGHALALERHSMERYLDTVEGHMRRLVGQQPAEAALADDTVR